jgi:ABC-type branched-subunit amino acid transport system permease subunit
MAKTPISSCLGHTPLLPNTSFLSPTNCLIISAVFGGLGTFFGAIIGALTIYILKNWILMEVSYSTGIMGLDNLIIYATLIILILKMPHGIFGLIKRFKEKD